MLKSIQFECKKVIKSPGFFVVIFGMLFLTIAYYVVVFINADKIYEPNVSNETD